MSKDTEQQDLDKNPDTIRQDWESGQSGKSVKPLFLREEMDIYVNKVTMEAFIFHGKEIDYSAIKQLEYDPADHNVEVIRKDGTRQDLGVKIQWLVRPYFTKSEEVNIMRTKDGKTIDGCVVPLVHKKKK